MNRASRRFAISLASFAFLAINVWARPFSVVVYNVEQLIDLDGVTGFEDYQLPRYTPAHALTKLQNTARLIAQFEDGRGPDILILSELEVDNTPPAKPVAPETLLQRYANLTLAEMLGPKFNREIADLPSEVLLAKALADRGITDYRLVIGDNVSAPGTARKLEQKNAVFTRFPVRTSRSHPTLDARAILEVQLDIDGALLYVFANHWKSGASDPVTEQTRIENARTLRNRLNEILRDDPHADVILGGDFNSQFNQKQRYPAMKVTALNDILGAQGNELAIRGQARDLYNLWWELPPDERGSDTWRGEWGTLMHLIISRGLYDFRGVQYVDNSFAVAKFPGLNVDEKGLPARWTFDGSAGGGFSDHLPILARFVTVSEGRTDRFIALRNASEERPGDAAARKIGYDKIDLPAVALTAAKLPRGTSIRNDAYKGKIFRVEGKVAPGERLSVHFLGDTFEVWSHDETLRNRLRAEFAAGSAVRFYGELGQFRGRWQFVIQDPSWVK